MSAPGSEAERRDEQRRLRQGALVREWRARNEARLNSRPPLVQGCLMLMAHREASQLVRRGGRGPLRLTAPAIELEMRRLITQLRRQRHGALDQVDAATWHAQIGAIAAELGWQWTAPAPSRDDSPARKLRGLEAAHAIGIALLLFAAPPPPTTTPAPAPTDEAPSPPATPPVKPAHSPTLADLLEA